MISNKEKWRVNNSDKENNKMEYYKIFRHKFKGEKSKKEDADQISCAAWLDYNYQNVNWFHPANEGNRTARYADKMKRSGLKAGVSDFIILEPKNGYFGAVIELKREDGVPSDIKKDQKEFLKKCNKSWYYTAVAFGFEEFKKAFLDFYDDKS